MVLKYKVKNQTILPFSNPEEIRQGSTDYLDLSFIFSNDWKGLNKILMFQAQDVSLPVELPESGIVSVPNYFCTLSNFSVTLYGYKDSVSIPTNYSIIELQKSNNLWTSDIPVPKPSWVLQMQELVEVARNSASQAEQAKNIAVESASLAHNSEQNSEAWAVGERGGNPVTAEDETYENNAKYYAKVAKDYSEEYNSFITQNSLGESISVENAADNVPAKSLGVSGEYDGSGSLTLIVEPDTIVFNQWVQNGDFASATDFYELDTNCGTVSVDNHVGTYTFISTDNGKYSNALSMPISWDIPAGHSIYMRVGVYYPFNGYFSFGIRDVDNFGNYDNHRVNQGWNKVSTIFSNIDRKQSIPVLLPRPDRNTFSVGDEIKYRNFIAFDLTEIFGAGNEPTADECNRLFPTDWYPYTLPSAGVKKSRLYGWMSYSNYIHTDYTVQVPAGIESGAYLIWFPQDGRIYDAGLEEDYDVPAQAVKFYLNKNNLRSSIVAGRVDLTYRLDPTLAYESLKNAIISLGGKV